MLDVPTRHREIVEEILRQFVPECEVWAFGSRVTGKAGPYSDLDLAILSGAPLDFGLLGRLRDAFSESDLPFKVDVVDWATTDEGFRQIIHAAHEVVQMPCRDSVESGKAPHAASPSVER